MLFASSLEDPVRASNVRKVDFRFGEHRGCAGTNQQAVELVYCRLSIEDRARDLNYCTLMLNRPTTVSRLMSTSDAAQGSRRRD